MMIEMQYVSALVRLHIWQIAVLSVAVGAINLAVSRRWPHLAYALWLIVLAKCFVPPGAWGPMNIWGSWTPTNIGWARPTEEEVEPASSFASSSVGWVESARPTEVEV